MTPPASTDAPQPRRQPITTTTGAAEPMLVIEPKKRWEQVALALFIGVPFLALVAAVPVAWGWGLGWLDVADRRGVLRGQRPRDHGRLPPLLHPRLVQGEPRR